MFIFFIVPLITLLKISLSSKPDRLLPNYEFTWEWSNFGTAFDDFGEQLMRSFVYAGIATRPVPADRLSARLLHRLQGRALRTLLLGLVMVPFFTSFLLRTIAWQSLLNDNGPVLGIIQALSTRRRSRAHRHHRRRPAAQHPVAVIGGLTYNFLPFMLLPIYVSLEKVDIRSRGRGRRPVLAVRPHVPQGHLPAVAARRLRRHAAHVHPGHRRLHQRRTARQPEHVA